MDLGNNKKISDQDLKDKCLQGELWAWEIFYERFSKLVSSSMKKILNKHEFFFKTEDLEECKQDIWLSLLKNNCYRLRIWKGDCSLATWIDICACTETSYFIRRRIKSFNKERFIEDLSLSERKNIDSEKGNQKKSKDIHKVIEKKNIIEKVKYIIENRLSDRERLFANLYWFDELTYEEIAKILNISSENLYLIKHRIEKKIKKNLKGFL